MPAGFADGTDDGASFPAGTGLTLTDTTFAVNTAAIQARVSGTCGAGQAIRVVAADGSVTCESIPSACCSGGPSVCGSGSYHDRLDFPVDVEFAHIATTTTVRVCSTLDQAASNESFGFSNFRLYTR